MVKYTVDDIARIIQSDKTGSMISNSRAEVQHILYDSRKLLYPERSIFFSLSGISRHGNEYIAELINNGVKNFVVSRAALQAAIPGNAGINLLVVDNVLTALQMLALHHRTKFSYPVMAITGSNGKTIVKEWLFQTLQPDYNIIRSPKSFNSQLGVPVSVLEMKNVHDLGIFEAGISQPGEMEKLAAIIQPGIGILTMIGNAHEENFSSKEEKIREKLQLFKTIKSFIFSNTQLEVATAVSEFFRQHNPTCTIYSWGYAETDFLQVMGEETLGTTTVLSLVFQGKPLSVKLPFTDKASLHNALTVITTLLVLGIEVATGIDKMKLLRPVEMRLELLQGINNCSVINDAYTADLISLVIAVDFLQQQQQHEKRTIILSDFANATEAEYVNIANVINKQQLHRFIGIGKEIEKVSGLITGPENTSYYPDTDSFISQIHQLPFNEETILIKGARSFQFERIVSQLIQKTHQTVLEINLSAIRHNLNVYRRMLRPEVKIMVMVKAFSYGSGSFEIANLLQYAGVDYLAVAYADEAVELRNAGITLPLMVMNIDEFTFPNIVEHQLEPEIFSLRLLEKFISFLNERNIKNYPIHLKVDTGMHRLGFEENDLPGLSAILSATSAVDIRSVFSHLAGSDSSTFDDFSKQQSQQLTAFADRLKPFARNAFMLHICNSSAIYRFPQFHFNMVRLGIGLYGFDANTAVQEQLRTVTTLKTTVAQIRHVPAGETIGYSRKGLLQKPSAIATVRLGYADGYSRALGNGHAYMLVNGKPAPTVGNICMDMTMLDVTGIEVSEEDQVIVFGEELGADKLASMQNTIAYEMLTSVSQRVKRLYYEE